MLNLSATAQSAMLLLFLLGLNIFGAASQRVTNKVFFDITIGGEPAGRITFGLFGDVVPKTVANFIGLATVGSAGLKYKGTQMFKIIPGFMVQGGDVLFDNGSGGVSIYGNAFADENFDIKLTKKYQLAMNNAGPHTNKSQFMITLAKLSWLSGEHVVFGEVVDGFKVVDKIANAGTWGSGKPKAKVVIADCGELPMEAVASESEALLAYTAKPHGESPFSLVNLFAAFGFAMTVYGAFRHYVK